MSDYVDTPNQLAAFESSSMVGQLKTPEIAKAYMFAGNAIKVHKADIDDPKTPWFVSVLNGPDNWTNYAYMGIVTADKTTFKRTAKSRVGESADSFKARCNQANALNDAPLFFSNQCEIWHEGRCGRCGRKLTVPESIEREG